MTTVFLSPIGNGQVFLAANALPANAGLINTYLAGTTIRAATYTTSAGTVQNANPIVLTAAGLAPSEIFLLGGVAYKLIVTDSLGTQIGPTYDNIVGINSSGLVSVKQFGAVGDGVTDDTAAIVAATQSFTTVVWPAGTYKVTSCTFNNITNCTWLGIDTGGINITTATAGTMLTWSGGGFNLIDGFTFAPTGVLASSTGMVLSTAANNYTIRNCVFQLWTKIGLQHLGTVGTPLSGHKVYDCYFLQNANASTFGQLDMTYSNDFFVQNNQMGIINTGTYGFPSFGIRASNTSNGSYFNNYIWQNFQGAQFSTCAYDRFSQNRFEMSQQAGVIFNACTALMFQDNWLNNNGIATINTYNQLRVQVCVNSMIHGNNFWDWSSGANSAKYSASMEGACTRLSIKNNVCDKYGTAAWQFDSSMPATTNTTDGSLNFTSGGNINAAVTTFIGQGAVNATSANAAQYPNSSHTMVQLTAQVTVAPGAGQTFIYTVYKNGIATGLTLTLTGAGVFQGVANATTVVEDTANNANYSVQVVTSAGAGVATHFAQIVFCNR